MKTPSVSSKNTKQEIWDAYQDLLDQLNEEPLTSSTITKVEKANTAVADQLIDLADRTKEAVDSAVVAVTQELTRTSTLLSDLKAAREAQTRLWQQEQTAKTGARTREEEEYAYEVAKRKKRQDEELAETKAKVEEDLARHKAEMKMQEDEVTDLRNQAKTFDARMEKAVKDAVTQTAKDLTTQFEHERALATEKTNAAIALLEQKITLLEETIASQKQEITRLTTSATQAAEHVTRIAERAVTKGTTQPQQSIEKE